MQSRWASGAFGSSAAQTRFGFVVCVVFRIWGCWQCTHFDQLFDCGLRMLLSLILEQGDSTLGRAKYKPQMKNKRRAGPKPVYVVLLLFLLCLRCCFWLVRAFSCSNFRKDDGNKRPFQGEGLAICDYSLTYCSAGAKKSVDPKKGPNARGQFPFCLLFPLNKRTAAEKRRKHKAREPGRAPPTK
jgi:hypothetical protein